MVNDILASWMRRHVLHSFRDSINPVETPLTAVLHATHLPDGVPSLDDSAPANPRDEFFPAVGRCLHAWGFVELEIANLYMILLGVQRDAYTHPARAAFEAVVSLKVRLGMIKAYVAADPALQSYIGHANSLSSKVIKKYEKRHEVAHFLIAAERTNSGLVYALRPFVTMYGFSQKQIKALSLAQLQERADSFNELADRIRQHVQHVGSLKGLPTAFYARAGEIAYPPLPPSEQPEEPGNQTD